MKEVYNYLYNLLSDETVVIALSGGPDSMALFDLLLKVRKEKNINIVCAHVNHNVREESLIEEDYVKKLCKKNNVIFELLSINDYGKNNFEEEAREKRYTFFYECIKKYNAKYLFTAHHGDDLIETILMRLVRGSSIKGYAGFNMVTDKDGYSIIRPLISVTKNDILSYNEENNIKYFIDKTNLMDIHTRNRYRNNILPKLKEEDKNVHLKFLKFSNTLLMYEEYVNKKMLECIDEVYIDDNILISKFIKLDKLLQLKVLNYIFYKYYGNDLSLINDKHTNLVINLILSSKPNGLVKLPNGVNAIKKYNYLYFDKTNIVNKNYSYILNSDTIIPTGVIKFCDDDKINKSNFICRLDSSTLSLPLYVRNKMNGDRIYVKNMNGSKKLSSIFIDEKIPTAKRGIIPVVVDSNNEVIWIPGIKKSKYDKKIDEKYDIILKYEMEEK